MPYFVLLCVLRSVLGIIPNKYLLFMFPVSYFPCTILLFVRLFPLLPETMPHVNTFTVPQFFNHVGTSGINVHVPFPALITQQFLL